MRKSISIGAAALLFAFALQGCDLLDPTNVENPNLTPESVVGTPQSLEGWVAGLERQTAIAFNNFGVTAELTSDNYQNTQTFFNQNVDALTLLPSDDDFEDALFTLADLRESAQFGRNEVAPGDETATQDDIAETYFFEAVANVYTGELFREAPIEEAGELVPPAGFFEAAVALLDSAITASEDAERVTGYRVLQARAYRNLGNAEAATAAATEALASNPEYVRFVQFDAVNGPSNTLQDALYDRGGFDDLQPLPRLDFLDPKYYAQGTVDGDIPYVKAEEAHLVLIEDFLAEGDLGSAQEQMRALIDLVDERPVEAFSDAAENRTERNPGSRPDSAAVSVRASAEDPFIEGLVLNRLSGDVSVPVISGTSVTDETVDTISSVEEAFEVLYLMRQEIFFAEARRMYDLGIQWPVPLNEVTANPNLDEGAANEAVIPSYIESLGVSLDAFSYDTSTETATIAVNLNDVIAENRAQVSPFL